MNLQCDNDSALRSARLHLIISATREDHTNPANEAGSRCDWRTAINIARGTPIDQINPADGTA